MELGTHFGHSWQCNRHLHDASKLCICLVHPYDNFIWIYDFSVCVAYNFYKFACKDLRLLNIKSFKSKQYSLQTKAFGFHGCLIVVILNIFCIISYIRMIMVFLEQLIGSIGTYKILTIALCNGLLEKNNLSWRICIFRYTS